LDLDPNNAEGWRKAGEAAFRAKKYDIATEAYKNSLNLYPMATGIHYCIADALRQQNKYKEAMRYLRKGLQYYSSDDNLIALEEALKLATEIDRDKKYES
jgi:predicted Zn-dependent protease